MDIALDKIKDILHSTSGKAVFLECEHFGAGWAR